MAKAKKVKQLSITMKSRVGLLTEISSALSSAKVNITALCAWEMDNKAYFMIVSESQARAKKVLSKMKATISEEEAIAVELPNKVGALAQVSQKISDSSINIYYTYGTAGGGRSSICMFKTDDDKKAIRLINK